MSELRWAPAAAVVIAHLAADVPSLTGAHPTRPRDHKMDLPYAVVTLSGGSDDGVTDTPVVDVEVYAATPDQMWDTAEDVRQAMHRLAGTTANTGAGPTGRRTLVDTVRTSVSPIEVPYGPDVRRAIATYRLGLRKQLAGP